MDPATSSPFDSLPSGFNAGEPSTPEEQSSRESGWMRLQQTLSDPQMQMSLMRMGLQMMQPVPVGQTPVGHVAQAATNSMDYLHFLRQQELQNRQKQQQIDAQTTLQGAQTERVQAETQQVIPAQVAREKATTSRIEKLTPLEVDAAQKNLALLDFQIKDAPTESEKKRLQMEKEALQLKLDQQYGAKDRVAKIESERSLTNYRNALAAAQKGLESERAAKAAKATQENWKLSAVKQAEDNPYNFIVTHASDKGQARIASIYQPMPPAEAAIRAKQDAKAFTDEDIQARFPGKTREAAEAALAREYRKGHTEVQYIAGPGGSPPSQQPGQKPPTELVDEKRTAMPVPPALQHLPDQTIIPDKSGNLWWKENGQLTKATPEQVQLARQRQQAARTSNMASGQITPLPQTDMVSP